MAMKSITLAVSTKELHRLRLDPEAVRAACDALMRQYQQNKIRARKVNKRVVEFAHEFGTFVVDIKKWILRKILAKPSAANGMKFSRRSKPDYRPTDFHHRRQRFSFA